MALVLKALAKVESGYDDEDDDDEEEVENEQEWVPSSNAPAACPSALPAREQEWVPSSTAPAACPSALPARADCALELLDVHREVGRAIATLCSDGSV